MTAACVVGAAGWVATEVLESDTRYDGPARWVPASELGYPEPSGDPGAELNAEPQFVRETAWEDRAVQACEREPGPAAGPFPAPTPTPAPPLAPGPSPAPDALGTVMVDYAAVLCVVAAEESVEYRKWGLVAPPPRTPDR
ncbi:hypothetical protein CUT44_32385 [Streptomyces carminius]|uniref:Uncharacterized protein n=1 Tax=Streptomyces carminius TaxID=2665496 RepID=A0A2M8LPK6_9ACTN|nr:hypothetical protein [Streptomyces carminius]PJE93889.1 hypothetical protein CUT44_32385 [Streptomyces carminius]